MDFFSVRVELGVSSFPFSGFDERQGEILTDSSLVQPSGAEKLLPLGKLSESEAALLKAALPELAASIASTFFSASFSLSKID